MDFGDDVSYTRAKPDAISEQSGSSAGDRRMNAEQRQNGHRIAAAEAAFGRDAE